MSFRILPLVSLIMFSIAHSDVFDEDIEDMWNEIRAAEFLEQGIDESTKYSLELSQGHHDKFLYGEQELEEYLKQTSQIVDEIAMIGEEASESVMHDHGTELL